VIVLIRKRGKSTQKSQIQRKKSYLKGSTSRLLLLYKMDVFIVRRNREDTLWIGPLESFLFDMYDLYFDHVKTLIKVYNRDGVVRSKEERKNLL
jgi:hypothetical protein